MALRCELTGKGPLSGNLVSHSNIKTRTRWIPNIKQKKYTLPELGLTIRLKLSTHAIKIIDKQGGISRALRQAKTEKLSDRLLSLRNQLLKAASRGTSQVKKPAQKTS